MNILVSGFEAFLGFEENVTQILLENLPNKIGKFNIIKLLLPVVYGEGFFLLDEKINLVKPDYVIALGMAASRKKISIEKIAVNINDSQGEDNKKVKLKDSIIVKEGDLALGCEIHFDSNLYNNPYISNSYSGGTYVCNDLYYRLLNERKIKKNVNIDYPKAVFVHCPSFENIPQAIQLKALEDIILSIT